MSDYNIATKKLEELAQSIHDAREIADTEYKKSFEELANKSADLLTEINAIKDQKEKQDKLIKELELKMEHSNTKEDSTVDTKFAKDYYQRCDSFLRSSKAKSIGDIEFFNKTIDYVNAKEKNYFPINCKINDKFRKAVIEGSDVQGGFWILPEWYSQDVTRYYETNPLRELSTTATTGSYELNTIIDDNLSTFGGWVGETQPRNQTDTAQIGELSIPIHEVFAQPAASQRMIEDADFDLVGWISNKTQQIFMLQENSAFMTGDGAKKPRGILDYPIWGGSAVTTYDQSTYERGALQYIKSGSNGFVTYDGLINLQTSLLEPYQPNALFLMSRATWAQTLQLKDTQERPLYNLANLLATGAQQVLLGKNVRIAAADQTIEQGGQEVTLSGIQNPATDSKSIIYGDFKMGYLIVDRTGFMTITDIYTNKPFTLYYATKRLGGGLFNYQSLKVFQLSA